MLYHGTAAILVPLILKRGLVPHAGHGADDWAKEYNPSLGASMERGGQDEPERVKSVYLTNELVMAVWFARMAAQENKSDPAVLSITLPDKIRKTLKEDEKGGSNNAWRYPGTVSPAYIATLPHEDWADVSPAPLPTQDRNPLAAMMEAFINRM